MNILLDLPCFLLPCKTVINCYKSLKLPAKLLFRPSLSIFPALPLILYSYWSLLFYWQDVGNIKRLLVGQLLKTNKQKKNLISSITRKSWVCTDRKRWALRVVRDKTKSTVVILKYLTQLKVLFDSFQTKINVYALNRRCYTKCHEIDIIGIGHFTSVPFYFWNTQLLCIITILWRAFLLISQVTQLNNNKPFSAIYCHVTIKRKHLKRNPY